MAERPTASPPPAAPRPSPAADEHAAEGDPESEMEEAAQRLLGRLRTVESAVDRDRPAAARPS
eukprot:10217536-Alexandrium_andersonii.AAC.1